MRIKHSALFLAVAGLLTTFTMAAPAAEAKGHAAHHPAHWGYSGENGANHWGSMEPGFALCKNGKEQSPININMAGTGKPSSIDFGYAQSGAEVINNGHTIQVNLANGGAIKLDGSDYTLLQFHFHTPSEEKIGGKSYPMVAHLVHKSAAGQLAVVAVLFELGDENQALKPIFSALPAKAAETTKLMSGFNTMSTFPPTRATTSSWAP